VIHSKFWENKKVLITGHTGFKGSWLTIILNKLGSEIHGLSIDEGQLSLSRDIDLGKFCKSHIFDLRDKEGVKKKVANINPEIIIHLAAQSLVLKSYKDPYLTYSTNLMGLVNLYDSIRQSKNTKVILNVTSDKCYKNLESKSGYKENDILGGSDPYSNSKACAELISESYRESFLSQMGIASITARAGNVIGGGDWAEDRLIPDIMRSIINKQNLKIRYPNAIRPWQHVLEPLSGYLMLVENAYKDPEKFSEAWNFGPEKENIRTVKDIISEISKNIEFKKEIIFDSTKALHETETLKLDISKVKSQLNWKPKWGFEKTIRKTCDWYKTYISNKNIEKITEYQINEYFEEII